MHPKGSSGEVPFGVKVLNSCYSTRALHARAL